MDTTIPFDTVTNQMMILYGEMMFAFVSKLDMYIFIFFLSSLILLSNL